MLRSESGEALGEESPFIEDPFALEAGSEALDRAGRKSQHDPDEQGGRQSSGNRR